MNQFHCPDCNYTTRKSSTFKSHTLSKKHYVNANQIPLHKCNTCGTRLDNRSNWLRHLREVHQLNTNDLANLGYYIINLQHNPQYTLTND
jgi:transcription elongation factor Elf1